MGWHRIQTHKFLGMCLPCDFTKCNDLKTNIEETLAIINTMFVKKWISVGGNAPKQNRIWVNNNENARKNPMESDF